MPLPMVASFMLSCSSVWQTGVKAGSGHCQPAAIRFQRSRCFRYCRQHKGELGCLALAAVLLAGVPIVIGACIMHAFVYCRYRLRAS